MAKITFQEALPRRSLYEDVGANPSKRQLGEADDVRRLGLSRIATNAPAPVVPVLSRELVTPMQVAELYGVPRTTAKRWSTEAPDWVTKTAKLVSAIGLDAARSILSGVDEAV